MSVTLWQTQKPCGRPGRPRFPVRRRPIYSSNDQQSGDLHAGLVIVATNRKWKSNPKSIKPWNNPNFTVQNLGNNAQRQQQEQQQLQLLWAFKVNKFLFLLWVSIRMLVPCVSVVCHQHFDAPTVSLKGKSHLPPSDSLPRGWLLPFPVAENSSVQVVLLHSLPLPFFLEF